MRASPAGSPRAPASWSASATGGPRSPTTPPTSTRPRCVRRPASPRNRRRRRWSTAARRLSSPTATCSRSRARTEPINRTSRARMPIYSSVALCRVAIAQDHRYRHPDNVDGNRSGRLLVSGYAGKLLGRRYRLVEPVGSGGMAVVWRARDEVLGRDVAVKLLAGDLATEHASRARIQAEAQAIARLSHPNITSVHDYGENSEDGTRYVVMELLSGQLLANRLRSGPMAWRRATQIGAQIAAALAAAHERG